MYLLLCTYVNTRTHTHSYILFFNDHPYETILYVCIYHKQGSKDSMSIIVARSVREQFVCYLYMANEMLGGSTWLEEENIHVLCVDIIIKFNRRTKPSNIAVQL